MTDNKRSKTNVRDTVGDSVQLDQLTELVLAGSIASTIRQYDWIETQFEKQNHFISERSNQIEAMKMETKSSIFTEIEEKCIDLIIK